MAIAASGAVSLSDFRTEFVGGSAAISLSDLYRGGSNVRSKAANNTATNLAASVPTSGAIDFADFYGAAKGFRKTYTEGATNQNASSVFGDDYGVNYPKEIVINSGVELGATTTGEEALQIDSGLSGGLTITNNGTLSGAGGAAGGGAGGDAFEANVACTLINNGTIRSGGGGGGAGGTGGQGSYTTSSTTSLTVTKNADTYYDSISSFTTSQTASSLDFRVSYTGSNLEVTLSTRPSGWGYTRTFVSPANNQNQGSGTYGGYGWTWDRATRGNVQSGGTIRYQLTGTNVGAGSIAVQALDYSSSPTTVLDYNSSTRTVSTTNYSNGGSGGAGGRGQGYNQTSQSGSAGAAGGTNAGAGGTGGSGGGYGASGATGNTGANGNHTNGSGGSGGGAAGKYIRGLSNVTFTNNGTVQGGTA